MNSLFEKLISIRNKIEVHTFYNVYKEMKNKNISISKENFCKTSNELGYYSNNSYTKYVKFIEYFIKNKKNENK